MRHQPFSRGQVELLTAVADSLPDQGFAPGWGGSDYQSLEAAARRHNSESCGANCPLHVSGIEVRIIQRYIGPRAGKRWVVEIQA